VSISPHEAKALLGQLFFAFSSVKHDWSITKGLLSQPLVLPLLLWKTTRFHDKKTLDSQKNTRLQKQT